MARAELFVAVSVALLGGAFVGYLFAGSGLFQRQPFQRSLLSIKGGAGAEQTALRRQEDAREAKLDRLLNVSSQALAAVERTGADLRAAGAAQQAAAEALRGELEAVRQRAADAEKRATELEKEVATGKQRAAQLASDKEQLQAKAEAAETAVAAAAKAQEKACTDVQPPDPLAGPPEGYVERRLAVHLEELRAICPDWRYTSCQGRDKSNWSDAGAAQACCHAAAAGHWSYFKLRTFNASGTAIAEGGDTWYVKLHHIATGSIVVARVFDEGDGTYLVAYLPRLAGTYRVTAYLYYTRCLGYQEMPPKSTQRGEGGKLKYEGKSADWPDYCYIGHKAALPEVEVPEVAAGAAAPAPPASGRPLPAAAAAAAQRAELQAGVYRSEEHMWWDGDRLSHGTFAPDQQQRWGWPTSGKASRIVLAGDSTIVRSFAMLSGAVNAPCEVITAPHTWVSPDYHEEDLGIEHEWCGNFTRAVPAPHAPLDPLDDYSTVRHVDMYPAFQKCRTASSPGGERKVLLATNFERFQAYAHLKDLGEPLVDSSALQVHYSNGFDCSSSCGVWDRTLRHITENDTLVINIGFHCMLHAPWKMWVDIVDVVAAMLKSLPTPNVFWRSSPVVMQHYSNGYHQHFHFFSDARRLVYDLYAEREMRRRGVRVIDISAIPANYSDFTHFDVQNNNLQNVLLADALC